MGDTKETSRSADGHGNADGRPPRVEVFVDGTNFHLSLRDSGIHYPIDLNLLANKLSRGFHFVKLRYYTSPLPNPGSNSYRAQQRFFAELERSRRIELILGRHETRVDPATGRRYHVEKETDVNLAVDMVVGAYENRFDVAMLLTGDTDFVRAIRAVRESEKTLMWCPLPYQRNVSPLAQACDSALELDDKFLRGCAKFIR